MTRGILGGLGLWITLWAGAAAAKTPYTPYDTARLETVYQAVISPDGTQAAYLLGQPRIPFRDADGPSRVTLHVVSLRDGAAQPASRRFVGGDVAVSALSWRPGGRQIAFLDQREGDKGRAVYAIAVDGGEAIRLFGAKLSIAGYSLASDGARVAYWVSEPGAHAGRADGFERIEVFEEDRAHGVAYVAGLTGSQKPVRLQVPGSVLSVHFGPRGKRVAVVAAKTPLTDDHYMRSSVSLVDARTGAVTATVESPGKLGQVRWAPDGQHLALVAAADLNDPRAGRIRIVSTKGGAGRLLLTGWKGHVRSLAWRSAETLAFVGDVGLHSVVGEIKADGSGHVEHVRPGRLVLSGLTVSADGSRYVTLLESAAHPREVAVGEFGQPAPVRKTFHNPWLLGRALGRQETVTYEARDGLTLQGVLMRPADAGRKRGLPLIVHVHGGPEAHVRDGWNTSYGYLGHMATARGFAVFLPNYRGSTGRGVAFSKLSQGDPAGKEFDDIVDGVDHLVRAGLVDKQRVGLSGGSYGGYAAAWAATYYSDRFAAAVMFVGISNKISKAGTTDIPDEDFLVHSRHRPWEAWQLFLERSPIFHVQKGHTPLLIAHGKEDPRVNPGQSLELYRHLKTLGRAPVRLVFYEGEGHGNRRAATRLDYNMRMMRWMERYLLGPAKAGLPPLKVDYQATWKTANPVH